MANSRAIRWSYACYERSPIAIRAFLLIGYGLACYLSLARSRATGSGVVYFASYPNERRVLSQVREVLGEEKHDQISISKRHWISARGLASLPAFLQGLPRLYKFSRKLVGRFEFMPACRLLSTVVFYQRFLGLLGSDDRAVFVASQYSPECLGLAAAAHKLNKKVLFANHANACSREGYVAPLHVDLAVVSSHAIASLYQSSTPHPIHIVPFAVQGTQKELTLPSVMHTGLVVGIYLTALTNAERCSELIKAWSRLPQIDRVFVRPHPMRIVDPHWDSIHIGNLLLERSEGNSLAFDIDRTDIAICGNSTVVCEILRGGCPVLYDDQLDGLAADYNGYLMGGLVCEHPNEVTERVFSAMITHYRNPRWLYAMRQFDAGYGKGREEIRNSLKSAIDRCIGWNDGH